MAPAAGVNLEFSYSSDPSLSSMSKEPDGFTYTTTTNSDGRFTFEFEEKSWPSTFVDDDLKGAYISLNNSTLMIRIEPGKTNVGNVYKKLPENIKGITSISFDGLSETDTVTINNNKYTYPFQSTTDTFSILGLREPYGLRPVQIYNDDLNAVYSWSISNNGLIKEGLELFPAQNCDTLINIDLTVSK